MAGSHTGFSPPELPGSSVLGSLTSESPEQERKIALAATMKAGGAAAKESPDSKVFEAPPLAVEQKDIETDVECHSVKSHDSFLLQLAAQQKAVEAAEAAAAAKKARAEAAAVDAEAQCDVAMQKAKLAELKAQAASSSGSHRSRSDRGGSTRTAIRPRLPATPEATRAVDPPEQPSGPVILPIYTEDEDADGEDERMAAARSAGHGSGASRSHEPAASSRTAKRIPMKPLTKVARPGKHRHGGHSPASQRSSDVKTEARVASLQQERDQALQALEVTRRQAEEAQNAALTMAHEARRSEIARSQIEGEARLAVEAVQGQATLTYEALKAHAAASEAKVAAAAGERESSS